jgi:uncharacterized protein
MLIRFTVANFLSFDAETEFSMVKGQSREHPDHIIESSSHHKILKTAVIYGANASGKSNLITAMNFARTLITQGTILLERINVKPFRLNAKNLSEPSKFQFEFVVGEKSYLYGFMLDQYRIHEEWLYEILTNSHRLVFERETDQDLNTSVDFGTKFVGKRKTFLGFVAQGTRPTQLFLTESIQRNVKDFESVFTWFDALVIAFPISKFDGLEVNFDSNTSFREHFQKILNYFDTGISSLQLMPTDFENNPQIPQDIKNRIHQELLQSGSKGFIQNLNGRNYVLQINNKQEVEMMKLITQREGVGLGSVEFDLDEESDGTQRLLDLIPMLMDIEYSERVVIVDELDRSLHPHLSRQIVEFFLQFTKDNQSQLIFSTHEVELLDFNLLRRDEIWFVEKNGEGASTLYSLEEFTPRKDKDIQTGYLLGRYGAIPMLKNWSLTDD